MTAQTLSGYQRELLRLLQAEEAPFLVVGGWAVRAHGYLRSTHDVDVWIDVTADSATRVVAALRPLNVPVPLHRLIGNLIAQITVPNLAFKEADLLGSMRGAELTFADCWARRVWREVDGALLPVLALPDLIMAKVAAANDPGCPAVDAEKHRRDVAALQALETPRVNRARRH